MLEQILSPENFESALEHLLQKNDSCGADGLYLSELSDYLKMNGPAIATKIRSGIYQPAIIEEREILGKNGKPRTICRICSLDRLLLRAIHQALYQTISPFFSANSFAYREGVGLTDAVKKCIEYIQLGYNRVIEIDIENYFDSIPHQKLFVQLSTIIEDTTALSFIKQFIKAKIRRDFETTVKNQGLIQGSPLSPVLSNLYLMPLDDFLEAKSYLFVRFADDIKIFAKDEIAADNIINTVRGFLSEELCLKINPQKSGVYFAIHRIYLGYKLKEENGVLTAYKHRRDYKTVYNHWHVSAIGSVDNDYHILSDGILTRKDFSILYENDTRKVNLPIQNLGSLNLYSNITLASSFLEIAAKYQLRLNFFDKHGEFIGHFSPVQQYANNKTGIAQFLLYSDAKKRLTTAKILLMAAMHNLRANLRYYHKHTGQTALAEGISSIGTLTQAMNEAETVNALMLLEARSREIYFSCFNHILHHPGFVFTKRSRRPPLDALNSLISFGNALMYRLVAKEIYKTRLDIRISFLHSPLQRSENLNLDLAELFKPVIIDRLIFTLINKRMIDSKLHFDALEGGAVLLNAEGKRLFLQEYREKLKQKIMREEEQVTYEALIRKEIAAFQRFVEGTEKYKPYKYR